jgi:flagellar protein FlbD
MIAVTRLDGTSIVMNIDRIESLESVPETVLRLVDGRTVMVRESVEHVVDAVTRFKRAITQHEQVAAS